MVGYLKRFFLMIFSWLVVLQSVFATGESVSAFKSIYNGLFGVNGWLTTKEVAAVLYFILFLVFFYHLYDFALEKAGSLGLSPKRRKKICFLLSIVTAIGFFYGVTFTEFVDTINWYIKFFVTLGLGVALLYWVFTWESDSEFFKKRLKNVIRAGAVVIVSGVLSSIINSGLGGGHYVSSGAGIKVLKPLVGSTAAGFFSVLGDILSLVFLFSSVYFFFSLITSLIIGKEEEVKSTGGSLIRRGLKKVSESLNNITRDIRKSMERIDDGLKVLVSAQASDKEKVDSVKNIYNELFKIETNLERAASQSQGASPEISLLLKKRDEIKSAITKVRDAVDKVNMSFGKPSLRDELVRLSSAVSELERLLSYYLKASNEINKRIEKEFLNEEDRFIKDILDSYTSIAMVANHFDASEEASFDGVRKSLLNLLQNWLLYLKFLRNHSDLAGVGSDQVGRYGEEIDKLEELRGSLLSEGSVKLSYLSSLVKEMLDYLIKFRNFFGENMLSENDYKVIVGKLRYLINQLSSGCSNKKDENSDNGSSSISADSYVDTHSPGDGESSIGGGNGTNSGGGSNDNVHKTESNGARENSKDGANDEGSSPEVTNFNTSGKNNISKNEYSSGEKESEHLETLRDLAVELINKENVSSEDINEFTERLNAFIYGLREESLKNIFKRYLQRIESAKGIKESLNCIRAMLDDLDDDVNLNVRNGNVKDLVELGKDIVLKSYKFSIRDLRNYLDALATALVNEGYAIGSEIRGILKGNVDRDTCLRVIKDLFSRDEIKKLDGNKRPFLGLMGRVLGSLKSLPPGSEGSNSKSDSDDE